MLYEEAHYWLEQVLIHDDRDARAKDQLGERPADGQTGTNRSEEFSEEDETEGGAKPIAPREARPSSAPETLPELVIPTDPVSGEPWGELTLEQPFDV